MYDHNTDDNILYIYKKNSTRPKGRDCCKLKVFLVMVSTHWHDISLGALLPVYILLRRTKKDVVVSQWSGAWGKPRSGHRYCILLLYIPDYFSSGFGSVSICSCLRERLSQLAAVHLLYWISVINVISEKWDGWLNGARLDVKCSWKSNKC